MLMVVPAPGVLSAWMLPPWATTIWRAIAGPSLEPPLLRFRERSARQKRSKMCGDIGRGNALSGIADAQHHLRLPSRSAFREPFPTQRNAATRRGVAQRIADQVARHLLHPLWINLDRGQAVGSIQMQAVLLRRLFRKANTLHGVMAENYRIRKTEVLELYFLLYATYVAVTAFSITLNGREGLSNWLNVPARYSFARGA